MNNLRKLAVLAVALVAMSGAVRAADAGATPAKPKPNMAASTDLQKLIDQFKARRDSMLADREALLTQLKNATAEQRQGILAKMEAQQKDLIQAQRALGKQIRDEMRRLHQTLPAGAGGPGRR